MVQSAMVFKFRGGKLWIALWGTGKNRNQLLWSGLCDRLTTELEKPASNLTGRGRHCSISTLLQGLRSGPTSRFPEHWDVRIHKASSPKVETSVFCPCCSSPFSSVQSLSHVRLWNPMDCSTPGFPVYRQLPELAQTHVHQVGDAIQPSHPLSSSSVPALNISQHQGLFQWASSSHQLAKVLEFQPQHQFFNLSIRLKSYEVSFQVIIEWS